MCSPERVRTNTMQKYAKWYSATKLINGFIPFRAQKSCTPVGVHQSCPLPLVTSELADMWTKSPPLVEHQQPILKRSIRCPAAFVSVRFEFEYEWCAFRGLWRDLQGASHQQVRHYLMLSRIITEYTVAQVACNIWVTTIMYTNDVDDSATIGEIRRHILSLNHFISISGQMQYL